MADIVIGMDDQSSVERTIVRQTPDGRMGGIEWDRRSYLLEHFVRFDIGYSPEIEDWHA